MLEMNVFSLHQCPTVRVLFSVQSLSHRSNHNMEAHSPVASSSFHDCVIVRIIITIDSKDTKEHREIFYEFDGFEREPVECKPHRRTKGRTS